MKMKRLDKNKDYITGRPLLKGFNVHHLDLNEEHYEDLNEEHFICLNKKTHETIHFLYRYFEKDEGIIERLKEILIRMKNINND